jgi:uncharacterized protein (DUF2126 family)
LGYRLPLQALPLQENTLADVAQSPWDESRNPLPQDEGRAREKKKELAQNFPRTALCVEIRKETLHVFLPPMLCVEHYFSVIELLERIAAETGFTIIPEGYEPPADSRLRRWIVEPDVGAIKLTLPEAAAWAEHQTYLQMAYLEAAGFRACRKAYRRRRRCPPTGQPFGYFSMRYNTGAKPVFKQAALAAFLDCVLASPSLFVLFFCRSSRRAGRFGAAPG